MVYPTDFDLQPLTEIQREIANDISLYMEFHQRGPTIQSLADDRDIAFSTMRDHLGLLRAKGWLCPKNSDKVRGPIGSSATLTEDARKYFEAMKKHKAA